MIYCLSLNRYCPTHRTGWNWELAKFIKKIKTPDYKGEIGAVSANVCLPFCRITAQHNVAVAAKLILGNESIF